MGSNATLITNTGGTVDAVDAQLTILGGGDSDLLSVDDSGDNTADTDGQLTANTLTGLGMSVGIDTYSNIEDLQIFLGSGSDEFLVLDTHQQMTLIEGNGGGDIISVRAISGPTTINTNGGNDTVNVGSNASAGSNTGGTVNDIGDSGDDTLTINGGGQGNADVLDVDDTGDGVANIDGQLTATTLTGLGMSAGINTYTNIEDLQIHLGSGADEFLVLDTHQQNTQIDGTGGGDIISVQAISGPTTINTGGDDDTVNVGSNASAVSNTGGTVNNIGDTNDDTLTVNGGGQSGADVLDVDDTGDGTDNTDGQLTGTTLTGLGMSAGINTYSNIEDLRIHLGSGADQFLVIDTHQSNTQIDGNDGGDIVNIRATSGPNAGQ